MNIRIIAPPDMPERQLAAIEAIERRAAAYRASFAGQSYLRNRQAQLAARKGTAL